MKSYDMILRQGEALLYNQGRLTRQKCDIGVQDGRIAEIATSITAAAQKEMDLNGLTVMPGVIDSQVHFREPGLTQKEDIETGTKAALLGGVTAIFEMPNTMPPTIHMENLEEKLRRAEGRGYTHYAFYAGAADDNSAELSGLENHPHCPGIKVFMGSSTGNLLIESDALLEKVLLNTHRRIIVHSEDEPRLKARRELSQQHHDVHQHPIWRDVETAVSSTRRLLKLARKHNHKVHILHISTAEEMEILKNEKDLATVEVLPNHLTFWAPDCYDRLGTYAQQNPPIREKRHHDALWKAVQNGTADVIGSDHAPHTREEKDRPYPQSPSGTPGVQTLLPVMLNHVNNGMLSLERLTEMITENPRKIFGIKNKGRIEIGYDADFSIVDLKKNRTIENKWIASRCGWTPFDGMKVQGWPIYTILLGHLAMAEDEIMLPPQGRPVTFEK
jgi:dihydroorotase